ncbi:uncharacterized protein FOMMEDRAFT_166649 [Fomitiporia mediterranea MF3/22]|uniref:uncharacterized protein n=1 Tax=Fomitiporia mediterranea (strain MF3/22) TaxID=694068 RepID=UPI000440976C|nr:uncharacterized protein FOMMEDRAFT_166649 [Fomitiporia mediterranea MF3/22]EJD04904.1 hypothetical protein FOMMEDRAFT_166649 [Fomitiporia mediterranea MF3/22]
MFDTPMSNDGIRDILFQLSPLIRTSARLSLHARACKLSDLPSSPAVLTRSLVSLFPRIFMQPSAVSTSDKPTPVKMWTLRENAIGQDFERPVWAVFASHEEVRISFRVDPLFLFCRPSTTPLHYEEQWLAGLRRNAIAIVRPFVGKRADRPAPFVYPFLGRDSFSLYVPRNRIFLFGVLGTEDFGVKSALPGNISKVSVITDLSGWDGKKDLGGGHTARLAKHQSPLHRSSVASFTPFNSACAAISLSAYDALAGHRVTVVPALESELEPFSKLQSFDTRLFSSGLALNRTTQSAVMGAQSLLRYPPSPTSTNGTGAETEAELFFPDAQDDLDAAYGLGHAFVQSQGLGYGSGNNDMVMSAMSEQPMHAMQALQVMQACGFTLSSNPPKARTGFRHGDWICAVPACGAHNFGRNVTCIQCAAPRSTNLGLMNNGHVNSITCANGPLTAQGSSVTTTGMRNMSPRFANPMNVQSQVLMQAQAYQLQQQRQQLSKAQLQAQAQAQAHPLLTPSGRAFAVGGKVQNISPDPLAPCIMFWPDNEPFPDPGQIRPASLSNVHQPPIMNTGNKGPIEKQPGDWVCHKCEYLNWRRRKVCQTCFPYAEGNGDSISATMHAERLALLAAVYGQSHPQIMNAHAEAALQFPAHAQNFVSLPVTQASAQQVSASQMASLSSLPNIPFTVPSSSHRSQLPSAPAPVRVPVMPGLSVSTSSANLRATAAGPISGTNHPSVTQRSVSTPESSLGGGNIVYQTPPSPAVARPPLSISSALAHTSGQASPHSASPALAGSFLPSFFKNEIQPFRVISRPHANVTQGSGTGSRTPASLSPASSASADLPFDEHDGPAKPVGVIGSGRKSSFYAHPRGAGSGSSMGSSSSLTLAGGSIWSLDRDEDKTWNNGNGIISAAEAMKGLTL